MKVGGRRFVRGQRLYRGDGLHTIASCGNEIWRLSPRPAHIIHACLRESTDTEVSTWYLQVVKECDQQSHALSDQVRSIVVALGGGGPGRREEKRGKRERYGNGQGEWVRSISLQNRGWRGDSPRPTGTCSSLLLGSLRV